MEAIKSTEKKTVDFFPTVEAGDIELFTPFEQAIAVFGFTKVGKTSTCHILCKSILKAYQAVGGGLAYFQDKSKLSKDKDKDNSQYQNAAIGQTHHSQTQIPNIFDAKSVSPKLKVLDQPGYGDNYGFHRILSNGYFHYRTFSKTPKLKFILAFQKTDLQGSANDFKRTIQYFIKTFKQYDQIKDKILNATVFLITKSDLKTNIQDLHAVLTQLKNLVNNMSATDRTRYQQMIQHMLDQKKIFFIEKPASINSFSPDNNMLKQIYDKTEFWERPCINNMVDMSDVNFSVAQEILRSLDDYGNNEVFKQEYAYFMNHMMKRMKKILVQDSGSLLKLIDILKKDAKTIEDNSFINYMKEFNSRYYNFIQNFQTKRTKLQASLFNSNENYDLESSVRFYPTSDKKLKEEKSLQKYKDSRYTTSLGCYEDRAKYIRLPYFLKKFKVLDYIVEKINQITDLGEGYTDRTIEQLEQMSNSFIDIFKKLDILRKDPKDSTNIIYKYAYVIQRLIEQAKIITLILFNKSQHRTLFIEYGNKYKIEFVDIYRLLKDKVYPFIGDQAAVDHLKIGFCLQVNVSKFPSVDQQIVEFFENVYNVQSKLIHKIITLVLRYYQTLSQQKNKQKENTDKYKKYVAAKLLYYRQACYKFLINLQKIPKYSVQQKQTAIEQIFAMSSALSSILTSFHYYNLAREVYKSVNNAEMVFRMYEDQLKTQARPQEQCRLLMEYGHYACSVCRKDLALKCFSEAYNKTKKFKGLKDASQAIVSLQTRDSGQEQPYLKAFFNENFCTDISNDLYSNIENFCMVDGLSISLSIIKQ